MAQTSEQKLGSTGSLIALTMGALGAAVEAASYVAHLMRGNELFPPVETYLVVIDAVIAVFAVAAIGLMIKKPRFGSIALIVAGVASFVSDMVLLSTPPRMVPGGLMILSAVISFGTQKDAPAKGVSSESASAEPVEEQPKWMPVMIIVALSLHVVGAGFIGLAAGLVAPPLGVLFGWLVWAVVLFFGLRFRKTKPWYTLATPLVGIGAWLLIFSVGGELLGWTA